MHKYVVTLTAAALLTSLVGCNSGSSDSDEVATPAPQPTQPTPEPTEPVAATPDSIRLSLAGRYDAGIFGQSAAEIPAFDPVNQQIFVVNAQAGAIDVLDARDVTNPAYIRTLTSENVTAGAVVNSVAYHDGLIAVAVEAADKTDNGYVALYDATTYDLLDFKQVGALPDMLTFTPDGSHILVANEGEPSDDYQIDPEGSVSVIAVNGQQLGAVRTADFSAWNDQRQALIDKGVRIFGPGASVAQDLEPEYITVSADGATAWVALQENNALAKLDIASATITDILALGFKDHGAEGNGLDVSDSDGKIDIRTWPGLVGMYHPDSIASFAAGGKTWILTANEGDARAWGEDDPDYFAGNASKGFVEEFRVKHLVHRNGFARRLGDDLPAQLGELAEGALLNPEVFGYCGDMAGEPGDCREDDLLGRLTVSWVDGYRKHADGSAVMFDANGNPDAAGNRIMYDKLYAFGARSFSIWDDNGQQVWDSGDSIEQYIASDECMAGENRNIPCKDWFNSNHDDGNAFDNRSDNKGPEPEGLTVGTLGDKTFAFVGLERMGGIMTWDVTNPQAPVFVDYFNPREIWDADPATSSEAAGDLGPEGLVFVPAEESPNGEALLIVGNEVSGTTSIYQIDQLISP